jgi:hypothetical protein
METIFSEEEPLAESKARTPFAVRCWNCNNGELVYMTKAFYNAQMDAVNYKWICPRCCEEAPWDNKNYEDYFYPESEAKSEMP